MITFSGPGHTLEASKTGYENDPWMPERMVKGYPDVMIRGSMLVIWREAVLDDSTKNPRFY